MTQIIIKLSFFLSLSYSLYAQNTLQKIYYVEGEDINLSSIIKNIKKDATLYKFQDNKYTKRVKSKEVMKILASHGYNDFASQSRYIKFIKKSPIDTSKISSSLEEFYTNSYSDIIIKSITVLPRGYVKSLPKEYLVHINPKSNLSNKGTAYVKTQDKKKIFFDYKIIAKINLFMTKREIKRGEELSLFNIEKKGVSLERFRALPLQKLKKGTLQSKHNLKQGKIITIRDIQTINLVKRNTIVSVSLNNKAIAIEFQAKALQNGKLNDIITIQKNNGKRMKAIVIGKSKVEIK